MLDLLDRLLSAMTSLDFFRDAFRVLSGKPERGPPPPPEPAPDVSAALVAGLGPSKSESRPGFAKVDLPGSVWGYLPAKPLPPIRRIGWLVVGVGISVLMIVAVCLVIIQADADPDDPGAADVAFVLSPMLAIADAIVTGLLLVLMAARRLIPLTVARAVRALAAGVILGPLIYLTVLIVSASRLDAAHSGLTNAIFSYLVPTICAVGVTLITALVRRPGGPAGARANPS
jgi:hypothetical protein